MDSIRTLNNFVLLPIGLTAVLSVGLYYYNTQSNSTEVPADQVTENQSPVDPENNDEPIPENTTEPKPLDPAVFQEFQTAQDNLVPNGFIRGAVGGTPYLFEVRNTDETRAQGLSGRSGLDPFTGMLFVFEEEAIRGFWMQDMRFSIDIVWLDSGKRVVHSETNVSPDSYPTVFSGDIPAQYVLELPAGTYSGEVISFDL